MGALAQLAYGRRAAWAGVVGGSVALAAGVALIALSASQGAATPLLIGSVGGGAGFGLAFLGALRDLSAAIPPDHRARWRWRSPSRRGERGRAITGHLSISAFVVRLKTNGQPDRRRR